MVFNTTPHPDATMTNLSFLPETHYPHRDDEPLSLALNFVGAYERNTDKCPHHLDLGDKNDPKTLYHLWLGVKEAIGRDQRVYVTIDLPPQKLGELRENQ